MIGYIAGEVVEVDTKKITILTAMGVGYEINYGYFLEVGQQASLYIHHHISENDQSLWGFNTSRDKRMFELLKTVNKVGSSKAYPLITTVGTDGIIQAIMFDQPNSLSQAPGIGKKMAEQIILSLKDKIEKFEDIKLGAAKVDGAQSEASSSTNVDVEILNDVLMALDSLGYSDKSVASLVTKHMQAGLNSSEEIIKNVLREI